MEDKDWSRYGPPAPRRKSDKYSGDAGHGASSDSDDGECKPQTKKDEYDRSKELPAQDRDDEESGYHRDRTDHIGRGVTSRIQAYQGRPRFSGLYGEDQENIAEIYSIIVDLCDVTVLETCKAMSAMVNGTALSILITKGKGTSTFDEGVHFLAFWLHSTEKPRVLLGEYHSMSLESFIKTGPEENEISVFRSFVSLMMTLQHKMHH